MNERIDGSQETWEDLSRVLSYHSVQYPQMEAEDYVKLLYQNEFGCGHFIEDEQACLDFLRREWQGVRGKMVSDPEVDVGNGYLRLSLAHPLWEETDVELLARLFTATAAMKSGSVGGFRAKLEYLKKLCQAGVVPLPERTLFSYLQQYSLESCPAVHHSKTYRACYDPHYRIVHRDFWRYRDWYPLIEALLRKAAGKTVLLALDGPCGSGKSTLAALLQAVYPGSVVVPMDDFFLPPALRTAERLAKPGENLHYERVLQEVILPLSRGETAYYRPFCCATNCYGEMRAIPPAFMVIFEGSYALHPALRSYYNQTIWLTCSTEEQKRRLQKRESAQSYKTFLERWIPLEEAYAKYYGLREVVDCVVQTDAP